MTHEDEPKYKQIAKRKSNVVACAMMAGMSIVGMVILLIIFAPETRDAPASGMQTDHAVPIRGIFIGVLGVFLSMSIIGLYINTKKILHLQDQN